MSLPLRTRARIDGAERPEVLKVMGLNDLGSGCWPEERALLDLRDLPADRGLGGLSLLPWAGALSTSEHQMSIGRIAVHDIAEAAVVRPGDVVRVVPERQWLDVLYRRGSSANTLFATEQCNSYCLMCSQPPREVDDDWRVQEILDLVSLVDPDETCLGVSGGEPTLLGGGLVRIVEACEASLPHTALHVLSNGRRFVDSTFASRFENLHHDLVWGVPVYGDTASLHDYVVQAKGAFVETVEGLYSLARARQRVEIRVVLIRPVAERLTELVRFLARTFPFAEHIALMGIEPIGFARANRSALWIDPVDYAEDLANAVAFLDARGFSVSIYNLPLCVLPHDLWPFARQSISDWKNVLLPACETCAARARCGGFFASLTPEWTSRGIRSFSPEEVRHEALA